MSWSRKDKTEGGITEIPEELENKTLVEPEISVIKNNGASIVVPTTSGTMALTSDIPAAADLSSYATKTGTETLTNKTLGTTTTLAANSLIGANGGTIRFPNPSSGTGIDLATTTGVQTLSDKKIDSSCVLWDNALKSSYGGIINFPNPMSQTSITLPESKYYSLELNTTNFTSSGYAVMSGCGILRTIQLKLCPAQQLAANTSHKITTNYYLTNPNVSVQAINYMPCTIMYVDFNSSSATPYYTQGHITTGYGSGSASKGIKINVAESLLTNNTYFATVSFAVRDGYTEYFE